MSIRVETVVKCDICQYAHSNGARVASTRALPIQARQEAHQIGWMHVKRNDRWVDMCPRCYQEDRKR